MGFGVIERLILQAVAEFLPGKVGRFADGEVVIDHRLEMAGKGDAGTEVEAEHGLLQGELLQLAVVGEPVNDVFTHIETELGATEQEDTHHLTDTGSHACIASQHDALLLEGFVLYLQVVLLVEGAGVDGKWRDRQAYLQ